MGFYTIIKLVYLYYLVLNFYYYKLYYQMNILFSVYKKITFFCIRITVYITYENF